MQEDHIKRFVDSIDSDTYGEVLKPAIIERVKREIKRIVGSPRRGNGKYLLESTIDDAFACEEISKTLDLKDSLCELRNGLYYDFGIGQIAEQLTPRHRQTPLEKMFEDYLIRPGMLGQIEKGLKPAPGEHPSQYQVSSGIIDIDARDEKGKTVTVELKANKYNTEEVAWQLMRYLNAKGRENERVIFVAPRIKPDLFAGLRGFWDSGRLSYFEYSRANEGYSFKKINEEDIPDAGKIRKIWGERKNPEDNPKWIKVVRRIHQPCKPSQGSHGKTEKRRDEIKINDPDKVELSYSASAPKLCEIKGQGYSGRKLVLACAAGAALLAAGVGIYSVLRKDYKDNVSIGAASPGNDYSFKDAVVSRSDGEVK